MTAAGAAGVRPATSDDAEAIARVHVAAWQRAYDGLLPADLLRAQSVEGRTQVWRRQLADDQVRTWVADGTGQAVGGFASVGPSRDPGAGAHTGELYALYVHPASWRTGLGSRLMRAAQEALTRDYADATLWVLEANVPARGFYERHGWRLDSGRKQEVRGTAVLEELRYRLTW